MKKIFYVLVTASILAFQASRAHAIEVSFEEDQSLPLVYINVAVKAGAVTDPPGKSGLTNFLGEMLLRGTQSKTKRQIDLALDQMGAVLEFETRAEALILRGAVLSSQLGPFTDLIKEILLRPSFREDEISKLKSEMISSILEERGQDASLSSRDFNEYLFNGHPYGNPIMGKEKDIASFTVQDITDHYNKLVQDPLLLVVGTGASSEGFFKDWAKSLADAKPAHGSTDFAKVSAPQNSTHRRLLIVDKPERTQTQINAGTIGVKMTDSDYFPLYLGNYAFGGPTFSARLMVEIRVKRGWSYGAGSSFRQGLQPRLWQIHLFPAEKDTPPALSTTLLMVSALKAKGISDAEYSFSKESLINSSGFMYDTPKKRSENKLLERTLDLPDGFMKSYATELQKVSLSDVNAALKRFLKPDAIAVTVVGTARNLKSKLAQAVGIPENTVDVIPYTQEWKPK